MARGGHDRVLALQDSASGLRAFLALHHTWRGPAWGGIRVWNYRDEEAAMLDALQLSRAMTYKCVLAGVPGGGGKTVVLADRLEDRPAAMARLGQMIEDLGGIYRCGPDVGFVEADRLALVPHTQWFSHDQGALRSAGEATAEGVVWAIRGALVHAFGDDDLANRTVAIQGLGSTGFALAEMLMAQGARVAGADSDPDRVEVARAAGVEIVDPAIIYETPADVFSPCAMGGLLHDLTIQKLQAKIIAGSANNVLARTDQAQLLRERGILFLPDFVINSGALIESAGLTETGRTDFSEELKRIGATASKVIARSLKEGITTVESAYAMAREILQKEDQARQDRGERAIPAFGQDEV